MASEPKTPSVSNLFKIASDIDDVGITAMRLVGIQNLLIDAIENDIKQYPYSQYYVDALVACRDYAHQQQKEVENATKKLYAIYFANKEKGAAV